MSAARCAAWSSAAASVSMVLWGPPGRGQDDAGPAARRRRSTRPFDVLSATSSGVKDVRAVVARARDWIDRGGASTVLFIDEIHRFNKAQQDALLPHVEEGVVTLIGATTENPYFEVNSALLSRLRVFRLEPLSDEELGAIVDRALADERGFGGRVELADDAREHLVSISAGDARAVAQHPRVGGRRWPESRPIGLEGPASPGLEDIETAAQQRVLAYDRAGDGHYGTVSAFIKSMRGNDPDAALYWLATMVAAGEDPKFIARRIIISRQRRCRQRRPTRACRSRWPLPRRSTGWACRRRSTRWHRRRLRRHGAQVEPLPVRPTGRRWPMSVSTARCRCRSTCRTRHTDGCATTASASATSCRTTTRAPTSSSSTCPTSWSGGATTSRSEEGWEARIRERMDALSGTQRAGESEAAEVGVSASPQTDHAPIIGDPDAIAVVQRCRQGESQSLYARRQLDGSTVDLTGLGCSARGVDHRDGCHVSGPAIGDADRVGPRDVQVVLVAIRPIVLSAWRA